LKNLGEQPGPTSAMRRLLLLSAALFLPLGLADNPGWTQKHEEGRCAMRGQCGKQSFFGGELPCPDNGLAEEPNEDVRKKLVAICGDSWNEGPICCDDKQVSIQRSRFRAELTLY